MNDDSTYRCHTYSYFYCHCWCLLLLSLWLLQVQEKLPWFLKAVPSAECAKGGVGGYNNAVQMDSADLTGIAGLSSGRVDASSFRTYYVPLNTQQNFIDAYQVSHQLSMHGRLKDHIRGSNVSLQSEL